MSKIGLTTAIRNNLLSLQQISRQVSTTQNILSTGKKVNSAIDNPSSYYTAQSLTQRSTDLTNLLDAMGQAVSTIKAATEGIDAAANILTQMQAVTSQTIAEAKIVPLQNQCQLEDNAAELIAQGYTAINASMSASEIQAILNTDNAKVVLTEDLTLNTTQLNVRGKNVTINGGGHKLTNRGLYFYGAAALRICKWRRLGVNLTLWGAVSILKAERLVLRMLTLRLAMFTKGASA